MGRWRMARLQVSRKMEGVLINLLHAFFSVPSVWKTGTNMLSIWLHGHQHWFRIQTIACYCLTLRVFDFILFSWIFNSGLYRCDINIHVNRLHELRLFLEKHLLKFIIHVGHNHKKIPSIIKIYVNIFIDMNVNAICCKGYKKNNYIY